ncbi:MAG: TetR/AcrR family transcriptional regulator [Deltaproteobacteria bacterium]|nr:TetR/AcrR family transcriptional regulator [Deltaproteobacteria bacterium]
MARRTKRPPAEPEPTPAEAPEPEPAPAERRPRKGDATRRRIRDAAFALFAERGYAATTMRDIAERAGCALGLIYRYFKRREELGLELFAMIADDGDALADLIGRPLSAAFAEGLHRRIEALAPHRDVLRALASAALDRSSSLSLLGPETAPVRDKVIAGFQAIVDAAPDVRVDDRPLVARAMFVAQLLVVLAWLQDPSPQARHTHALIDTLADTLLVLAPVMPMMMPTLERYDRLLNAFIYGR